MIPALSRIEPFTDNTTAAFRYLFVPGDFYINGELDIVVKFAVDLYGAFPVKRLSYSAHSRCSASPQRQHTSCERRRKNAFEPTQAARSVSGQFTEGFEPTDLKAAKLLVD